MSWIADVLEATKEWESPQSYFYWSSLSAISAVVGKKVWLKRKGVYTLYPNIYVFLVSKRPGLRKSGAIRHARKLTEDLGTVRVIYGQHTIQGVLQELRKQHITNKATITTAQGFLIAGEFGASFLGGKEGIEFALTTLTDLYDTDSYPTEYRKRLASSDTDLILKEPCLSGLYASNATHFFNNISKVSQTGGFLSRTLIVYEEKKNRSNDLMDVDGDPDISEINYERILPELHRISQLKGPMVVAQDAAIYHREWYKKFDAQELDDDTGADERIQDNILKTAMLLSLAESSNMVISLKHMEEATEKGMISFHGLRRLMFGGSSDDKNLKAMANKLTLACILESPNFTCSRKAILKKSIGKFGPYELNETIEHFIQAGYIRVDKNGKDESYTLKENIVQLYLKQQGGNA